MEYKTLRSFFMRFKKEKLLKICLENKLAGDLKKSLCTKNVLSRLLAEHVMVMNIVYCICNTKIYSFLTDFFSYRQASSRCENLKCWIYFVSPLM